MNLEAVSDIFRELNQPSYRFDQVKQAYCVEYLSDWSELTTFSKSLRDACAERAPWTSLKEIRTQVSTKGDTVKTLFSTTDEKNIEAVLMRHESGRNTVCLSSQVGCAMACRFCATGTMGFTRNLTAEEMNDQVLHFSRYLKGEGARVTNVVFMGMGEPLHNLDQVFKTVHFLNDQQGYGLGARHITISTCGIVPGILRIADEPLQINLAISLHSAFDEARTSIMPVNRAYPLAKLMKAVDSYAAKTNRKVFFEYLLLQGINDSKKDAEELTKLLGHNKRLYHVNLIKYHDTNAFRATDRPHRLEFLDYLYELGMPATHRVSFGEDIDAACGQLAVNTASNTIEQGKSATKHNRERKENEKTV